MTREELESVMLRLEATRREDLARALDQQNKQIEKLFDARLETVRASTAYMMKDLDEHVRQADKKFGELYATTNKLSAALKITKLKVAAVLAAVSTIAGAVAAFVTKYFLSIVVIR